MWSEVLGSRFSVLGSRFSVLGSRFIRGWECLVLELGRGGKGGVDVGVVLGMVGVID